VLHDPGDPGVLAVAKGVDIDLDRVLEKAVKQQRVLLIGFDMGLEEIGRASCRERV